MNIVEWTNYVYTACPSLYVEIDMLDSQSPMFGGFDIPIHWIDVVYLHSMALEDLIVAQIEENKHEGNHYQHARAVQVKEKSNQLRFYMNGDVTDEMTAIVLQMEHGCNELDNKNDGDEFSKL